MQYRMSSSFSPLADFAQYCYASVLYRRWTGSCAQRKAFLHILLLRILWSLYECLDRFPLNLLAGHRSLVFFLHSIEDKRLVAVFPNHCICLFRSRSRNRFSIQVLPWNISVRIFHVIKSDDRDAIKFVFLSYSRFSDDLICLAMSVHYSVE